MTEVRLTRAAMAGIYGSACCLVVAAALKKKCSGLCPQGMQIFILHPSGLITTQKEKPDSTGSLPFIGVPAGLLGFIIRPAQQRTVRRFQAYAAQHAPAVPPRVCVPKAFRQTLDITCFINELISMRFSQNQQDLTHLQHEISNLRIDCEQSRTLLGKAIRMIRGVGLSTRAIVYDVPVGSTDEGPDAHTVIHQYRQVLPVDLIGISGVMLHVSKPASTEEGEVLFIIRRAADQKPVHTVAIPYSDFTSGWHTISLPAPITAVMGDAELCLAWHGGDGPRFSLADLQVDRFGDDAQRSLALRIEKGVFVPAPDTADDAAATLGPLLAYTHTTAAALFSRGVFYGGHGLEAAINARNGPVLTLNADEGWLQTHPLTDGLSGFHVPGALNANAREVRLGICLEHDSASPCLAIMAAVDPALAGSSMVEKMLMSIGVDAQTGPSGTSDGIQWVVVPVYANEQKLLKMTLSSGVDTTRDLLLITKPLHVGENAYGWCRWRGMSIGYDADFSNVTSMPAPDAACMHRVRTVTFPEIADRITFYRGKYLHNQLRLQLGFMPIQIHHEFSAMQTNPFESDLCAAELIGGLPHGAVRIACEVGTAHYAATKFTYIIGVISKDQPDRTTLIQDIVRRVSDDEVMGAEENAAWSSVTLPALTKRMLALDLPQTMQAGDVPFFCVIPAGGTASFGWCRWYSLAIETRTDNPLVTDVLPAR